MSILTFFWTFLGKQQRVVGRWFSHLHTNDLSFEVGVCIAPKFQTTSSCFRCAIVTRNICEMSQIVLRSLRSHAAESRIRNFLLQDPGVDRLTNRIGRGHAVKEIDPEQHLLS